MKAIAERLRAVETGRVVDWEATARAYYAIACAALGLESPDAEALPRGVKLNPEAACKAIVAAGASRMRPRALNPAPHVLASPEEVRRAFRRYRVTHWGLAGEQEVTASRAADPRQGVLTQLGTLREVTYETSKAGDPKRTWYTHKFSSPLPELAYSQSGLVICGGGYRVTWRGIVD